MYHTSRNGINKREVEIKMVRKRGKRQTEEEDKAKDNTSSLLTIFRSNFLFISAVDAYSFQDGSTKYYPLKLLLAR